MMVDVRFKDYLKFCKENNLSPCKFVSLQEYMMYSRKLIGG